MHTYVIWWSSERIYSKIVILKFVTFCTVLIMMSLHFIFKFLYPHQCKTPIIKLMLECIISTRVLFRGGGGLGGHLLPP